MPLPSTSKTRSARTYWGYHEAPLQRERRWWRWGGLLVLLAIGSVGLAKFSFVPSPGTSPLLDQWASPGHVADVHRAWNHDCDACHQPYQPIHQRDGLSQKLGTVLAVGPVSNERCQTCHAAPNHHRNMSDAAHASLSCADCHQDHQGAAHSLVNLAETRCVVCHGAQSLAHWATVPERIQARNERITGFDRQHPPFDHEPEAKPLPHRRSLKFSHAVHLLPGMGLKRHDPVTKDVVDGAGFTYGQIDQVLRLDYFQRHGMQPDNAAVQLICADCHRLDTGRPSYQADLYTPDLPQALAESPRGAGDYFQPITYEQHCRGCHPTLIDDAGGSVEIVHGRQPDEVLTDLERYFSDKYLKQEFAARLDANPDLIIKSLRSELEQARPELLEQARAAAKSAGLDLFRILELVDPDHLADVQTAAIDLFDSHKTCGECHYPGDDPAAAPADPQPAIPARLRPTAIPTIWQPAARFDHTAHQKLTCAECHPQSAKGDLAAERRAAWEHSAKQRGPRDVHQHPVDLPTQASCVRCHADRPFWPTGEVRGGVSHRCTDCHTYHAVDHGFQGRGSRTLPPVHQTTPAEMLRPAAGWNTPNVTVPGGPAPKGGP
jgi:hypothetical protein